MSRARAWVGDVAFMLLGGLLLAAIVYVACWQGESTLERVRREAWSAGYRRSDCDRTGDPDSCAMAKRYECAQGHGVTPDSEPHEHCPENR